MYKSLKQDYAREKEHFMQKMTDYEEILLKERSRYKKEIRMLREEVETYRLSSSRDKENMSQEVGMRDSKRSSLMAHRG